MEIYDKDGNYIKTKQDILNDKAKKANSEFIKRMEAFLKKHGISGIAYSYGFSTTKPDIASEKLKELGIEFRLDRTPNYHTKVLINKKQI